MEPNQDKSTQDATPDLQAKQTDPLNVGDEVNSCDLSTDGTGHDNS